MNAAASNGSVYTGVSFLCALWLFLFSTSCLHADVYSDASAAFERSDFQTAYDLLYPLAENGEARAQYELGRLHFQGWRVPGEYRTAVVWVKKAALQGYANAQADLGNLYRIGMVVRKDDVSAYAWLTLAAKQGNNTAEGRRSKLMKTMTTSQLAEARLLAEEFEREIRE